jgi:beta-D-xylosidase 4
VTFTYGCRITDDDESGFAAAIELARLSDIVIFFGGINQSVEAEVHDRASIALPAIQLSLIQQLEKVVRSPLHVVIMSGGGLDLSYIRDSNQCESLLWMGYGGQAAGFALTNVMFGQYNPGGRLPVTYYPASYVDAVGEADMQMRPSPTNPGRTYKFYTGQAVFEFGYGLSYTTFNYSWYNDSITSKISIESLMKHNSNENKILLQLYRVNVTNTGEMAGSDVVLAFITPPKESLNDPSPPIKKLFGFERVYLDVNQTVQVYFPLHIQSLLTIAQDGSKWLEPGSYGILIGKQYMHTTHLQGKPTRWS